MADRRPRDQYMTPAWAVRPIVEQLRPWLRGGLVLEPACGDCGIVAEVLRAEPKAHVLGVDIDPRLVAAWMARWGQACIVCANYLTLDLVGQEIRPTLVIGNPPYKSAEAFVCKALRDVSPHGVVAMLLRLAWMAGQDREQLHTECRPDVYVLPKRPSFTGNGQTDATDYAWFIWHRARRANEHAIWTTIDWRPAFAECQAEQGAR